MNVELDKILANLQDASCESFVNQSILQIKDLDWQERYENR